MKKKDKQLADAAGAVFPILLLDLVPYALDVMRHEKLRQTCVTLDATYAPEEHPILRCTPCTVKIELRATVTREEVKDA